MKTENKLLEDKLAKIGISVKQFLQVIEDEVNILRELAYKYQY